MGYGLRSLAPAEQDLAQLQMSFKVVRSKVDGLPEMFFGGPNVPFRCEHYADIKVSCGGIWIQSKTLPVFANRPFLVAHPKQHVPQFVVRPCETRFQPQGCFVLSPCLS